jgi:hypothetical protein
MKKYVVSLVALSATAFLAACGSPPSSGGGSAPTGGRMGFFVTSVNPGNGGNLGGLAGADAHCQKLAGAAGAGGRTWKAYLSTSPTFASAAASAVPSVDARTRIGKGPWSNAKGVQVAADLASLHGPGNNITKATALDERGNTIKGRGDQPNDHDILTGSRADGTAFAPQTDTTCGNWTKSADGSAVVGHHDRQGPLPETWAQSWNFSHQSAGCSLPQLRTTGGAGLYYCFAAD